MNFTLGTFRATPQMRELVDEVLNSGRLSYGPLSRRFEREFATIHDTRYGVLSNSGTSSLQVALQALKELHGWADGDEVIVPSLTFVATINVVYHCRLTPVLVDVEPDYYAIDSNLIEQHITKRTRCIMPVHPFGLPADMDTICDIASDRGLKIIEDSCEAMFVRSGKEERPVGSWGDVGCFSTYVAHLITGGIGGIGIAHNPDIAAKMRSLVNHGISLEQLPTGDPYDPTFLARNFLFDSVGHSFRVTELEAALLLPQLETREIMLTERAYNAMSISAALHEYRNWLQLPQVRRYARHAWMVYPMVLRSGTKYDLMAYLRSRDIECRDMLPLTTQPCYNFDPKRYPVSARINEAGFYIGCHQDLTDEHFWHLEQAIFEWSKMNYGDI